MRITFVSKGSLSAFKEGDFQESADVVVFGFNGVGEVSYEKELHGESCFLEEGAKLSKQGKNLVVFGCVSDICGHRRKSVVVAENGRLLGMSDMLHAVDGECSAGAYAKAYDTKIGKMGVVVAGDLYFPEVIKALALCGCMWIVCPFDKKITALDRAYICVYAHIYGVSIFLCGEDFCMVVNPKGEVVFTSPDSPTLVDYEYKKEYHLVETRCARYFP